MKPGLFETRIQQLLDGELHPDHWPEVREHLAESEEARRIYCGQVRLHAELVRMRRERNSLRHPVIPQSEVVDEQRQRTFRLAGAAAAALILLSGLGMYVIHVRDVPSSTRLTTSPNSIFTITPPAAGSASPEEDGTLATGSTIDLERGVLELEFASGVRSVVRGPASFTIESETSLDLARGTAWFRVPGPAAGFTVNTEGFVVTDLGTEFGVISLPRQAPSAHLFKGRIHLRSKIGAMARETISGSGARELSVVGRLKSIPPRPDRFFRNLPDQLPWLGWNFDAIETGTRSCIGTMSEVRHVHGTPRPDPSAAGIVPGRFGNALHVTGDGGFWQSDWPGLGGDAPRTLAFWIRLPDSPGYIHPLVGWGLRLGDEDTTTGSFFAFAETVDGRTVAGASLGACWIKGSTVIADNSWHHVAVTTTGKPRPDGFPDLRLFIDGREDEAFEFHNPSVEISPDHPMVVATEISHPDSRPLTAFAQILPGEDRGHPFAASMDELRIIEGALDPGEIRHLFEANELPDIHHR